MKLTTLNLQIPEKRSAPTPAPFSRAGLEVFGGGRTTDAGEVVNESTALSIATVYSCVRILAESVASLPLRLYRKSPTGRIEAIDEPLHYLLSAAPNPEMTAFTFVETLFKSMLLTGTAFAEIERAHDGRALALWPLNPRLTQAVRFEDDSLAFKTSDGMLGGQTRLISAGNVLHIPMFPSADGLVGSGPLQVTMQTFGQAIAADRFAARYFRNFATPALAIEVAEEVDPKTKAQMREDWEALQTGANAHRVAVLDQGAKVSKLSLTPDECQFIETRKLLKEDIAGIFRVPLYMLGSSERLSQASAEQLSLSFVTDTLRPLANRLCQEIARKLLIPTLGQSTQFVVEADMSERLRGDVAASTNYFKTGIQFGWLCPNDVRRELNLNEGPASLNVFQTPVNMMNSERLLDPPAAA